MKRRKEPEQETRARILRLVRSRPGLTVTDLCRLADIGWGTAQHHVRLLRSSNLLADVDEQHRRRLFDRATDPRTREAMAAILNGRGRDVLKAILTRPGIRQSTLTKAAGVSRKVLGTTIRSLVKAGLVSVRESRSARHYEPTEEAAALFEAAMAGRGSDGLDARSDGS